MYYCLTKLLSQDVHFRPRVRVLLQEHFNDNLMVLIFDCNEKNEMKCKFYELIGSLDSSQLFSTNLR